MTPPSTKVRYFAAGKDRGVFVTLNKLTKLDAGENIVEEEPADLSICESSLSRLDSQAVSECDVGNMQEQSGASSNPSRHASHTGAKVSLTSTPRESSCKCCALDDWQPLQQVASYRNEIGSKRVHHLIVCPPGSLLIYSGKPSLLYRHSQKKQKQQGNQIF